MGPCLLTVKNHTTHVTFRLILLFTQTLQSILIIGGFYLLICEFHKGFLELVLFFAAIPPGNFLTLY